MKKVSDTSSNPFLYKTLDELVEACVKFYHSGLEKSAGKLEVHRRREQLAGWVQKFHEECETLSSQVEESIENLRSGSGVLLMTAHQPNLFAYSGVLRKATLNQVLSEKLAERLKLPVVTFFGLADQDFTDDRWVRSALLPDVERRGGVLELHVDLPEKMMLNKVRKPSKRVVNEWHDAVTKWIERNGMLANRLLGCLSTKSRIDTESLMENLRGFWSIVEDAYSRAEAFSDFNGFVMSKIVNGIWGYNTLFARFSECQRIFVEGLSILISRFDDYSRLLGEVTSSVKGSGGGVYEHESETVPFWFHCDCGSKARLLLEKNDGRLVARGECIRCGKAHAVSMGSEAEPDITRVKTEISARSLAMPLVFFNGLGICCYVGGIGGQEYLQQAKHVAEGLNMKFPPIVVWRPKDVYLGLGQLGTLLTCHSLTGSYSLSQLSSVESELKDKIDNVGREIEGIESQKRRLLMATGKDREEVIERLKSLSIEQNRVRRENEFSLASRNLKLIENIKAVCDLHPCIIDCAVNVGLKETSDCWIDFLSERGALSSDIFISTGLQESVSVVPSCLGD